MKAFLLFSTPALSLVGVLASLVLSSPVSAQQNRPPRPKPVISPLFGKNGAVTFQIKAPEAKQVAVSGKMIEGTQALIRGEDGLWSVTLDSVSPGIYEYSFIIDGVKMVDPGNPSLKPQRSPNTSILHLAADAVYDFREVPHGTVHTHAHRSMPIGRFREFQVYTPPGYEKGTDSYPLLVLQHGHSDTFATWVAHGKAHWILDNLIAEKRAVPMIVVMLDGHPIPESYGDGRSPANTEELRRDLLEATLPMVETLYRVKSGRENRAIAGLSMGGLHALTIGLNGLDTFSWIGSFSAAVPEEAIAPVLADPEATNGKLKLLWIACGKDDFLLEENKKLTALLKEKGIRHEWHLTEGDHSWPVWRGYLADFAPRLFR